MSFQFIIDNATTVSINRKKTVASTRSRDGTVRSVGRGGQVWQFEVKLPDGPKWSDNRGNIAKVENLDRITSSTIAFSNPGHNWFIQYQGDYPNPQTFTATWSQTETSITITGGGGTPPVSGYRFRAGDVIQLGPTGSCYTVSDDVAYNATSVPLHRPILDGDGTNVTIRVAEACEWTVRCVQFPEWTLIGHDRLGWSGPFVFVEDLT